jgi:simple sugar transport system permease protein
VTSASRKSRFQKALIRPELGGIVRHDDRLRLVRCFSPATAACSTPGVMNWSQVSAQFMIIAVGACLLMIAGEFDLSVGSMIGFAGMMIAIFRSRWAGRCGWRSWSPSHVHGDRRAQRLHRGPHRAAELHRHAGLPVHPARLHDLLPQTIERKTIIGGIATRPKATGWRRCSAARS